MNKKSRKETRSSPGGEIQKRWRRRGQQISIVLASTGILAIINMGILHEEKTHRENEIAQEISRLSISLTELIKDRNYETIEKIAKHTIRNEEEIVNIEIYGFVNGANKTIAKAKNNSATINQKEIKTINQYIREENKITGGVKVNAIPKINQKEMIKEQLISALAYTTILTLLYMIRKTKKQSEEKIIREKQASLENERKINDTAKESIRMTIEENSDGWWEWNERKKIVFISAKLCRTLGMEIHEKFLNSNYIEKTQGWWKEYIDEEDAVNDFMNKNYQKKKAIEVKYHNEKGKGKKYGRIKRTELSKLTKEEGNIIFSLEDITEKITQDKLIKAKAFSDNLTGLANRAAFEFELEKISAERSRNNISYSLLIIDIDNFKHLNDSNGHVVGDLYLREISMRLKACLRPSDFVGRIGGDEFVVITKFKYAGDKDIETRSLSVGEKIRKEIGRPFIAEGIELIYQCSIGICTDKIQTEKTMSILDYADRALYKAKGEGRNRIKLFEESMKEEVVTTETIREQLIKEINNSKIEVDIQPIYDISLSRRKRSEYEIKGFEALFRCERIKIETEEIIKIAERTGLIREITKEVIKRIGQKLATHQIRLKHEQTLSINISPTELLDLNFPERFMAQIKSAGIKCNQIYIEVTETAFISNTAIAKRNMNKLKEAGIRFAIDDFGTGYSSISMLRKITVERIKLDRSYIHDIESEVQQALLKTSIWMARALDVELVAEGVETQKQLEVLSALGCKLGQGFWLDEMCKNEKAYIWRNES